MTFLLPSCARVTDLLLDYEDGALGPFDWLGVKLHLTLCPPCQTFLDSFTRTPALLRQVWDGEPTPVAEHALSGALAALREGRTPTGPQLHPDADAWTHLESGGDPCMALLLRVHLGHCGPCREVRGGDQALVPTPHPIDMLRPHLPPESQWKWTKRGLGGGHVVRLMKDARSGASLSLAKLSGGRAVPRHDHLGTEVSLLLCGGLQDGPAHLHPGDWITHPQGHLHGPEADPGHECWALVHLEGGIRFEGWRKLFGVLR